MTAKDLFENQHAMRLVKEFENKGIKWQGNMEIMTENLDNDIQRFEGVTGASGDFISEVMEKDSEDLFKYLLYRMRNIMMNGSYSILSNVHKWSIDFTVLKYFPDKLINYFCRRGYDKKWLQRHIFEYNEALGTTLEVPAKPKAAPKPKTPKSEKRVISTPLHETGLKYSEYDEDYYAMLIEDGKEGNVIVNPRVAAMGQKDGLMVYPPLGSPVLTTALHITLVILSTGITRFL